MNGSALFGYLFNEQNTLKTNNKTKKIIWEVAKWILKLNKSITRSCWAVITNSSCLTLLNLLQHYINSCNIWSFGILLDIILMILLPSLYLFHIPNSSRPSSQLLSNLFSDPLPFFTLSLSSLNQTFILNLTVPVPDISIKMQLLSKQISSYAYQYSIFHFSF